MPYEWLLITLPIVFVLGWFAARLDIRHIRRSAAELPRAYLRGLTELLNGNEEKALDAFSDIARKDTLPPELQFTVGELSRRRGDYRRALKAHQQLQANEKLSDADRNHALWEMAKDCAAMGFADAAEQHARLLAEAPEYRDRVFDFLLGNYQMRRRTSEALTLIKNADEDVRQLHQKTAAHLYCQLAQTENGDASALLNEALAINPACAAARLQLAQAALAAKPPAPAQALAHYAALAAETPQYLWLAAAELLHAHRLGEGDARGNKELLRWLRDFPTPMLFKEVIALLEKQLENTSDAGARADINDCLRQVIDQFVTHDNNMEAATYFIERQATDGDKQQWLAVKRTLLAAMRKSFICDNCSYEMNHFTWQCPCCLRWESFKQQ